MPDTQVEQTGARAARCAHHPSVARVAACDLCGLQLCIACAVPVRGQTVGPECLGSILDESPPAPPPPPPAPRTEPLAVVGFALVLVLSIFPWTEFGDSSGFFQAWTLHWSLLSVGAALLGLVLVVSGRRRPRDPRVEAGLLIGMGLLVGVAALLHHQRPPPLAAASITPVLAILAACLPVLAGALKAAGLARLRRPASIY